MPVLWSPRQNAAINEPVSSRDAEDVAPTAHGPHHRWRFVRSVIMLLLLGMLIFASIPWWLGRAQQAWRALHPPPAYTGSLLYGTEGARLEGLRSTDGGLQWSLQDIANRTKYAYSGVIYALNGGLTQLEAIRERDGHLLWSQALDSAAPSTLLGVDATNVYLKSESPSSPGIIRAFNMQSGKLQWSYQYPVGMSIAVDFTQAAILTCQSNDQAFTFTRLDALTGATRWKHEIAFTPTLVFSHCALFGSITTVQATQFADETTQPLIQTTIAAYDTVTGAFLWQKAWTDGNAVAHDGAALYIATWSGQQPPASANYTNDSLTAWDLTRGTMRWRVSGAYYPLHDTSLPAGANAPPLIVAGNLVAITSNGLAGIDQATGAVRWHIQGPAAMPPTIIPGIANDTVYYADTTGLYAINGATGQSVWRITTLAAGAPLGLIADHDHISFSAARGLYIFDIATGKLRWNKILSFYFV